MPASKQPKVLLFDIGGVCVVSPFQAILDYELSHDIPPGWVNNCISKTKPYGFWHRLERGEMLMDADWFAGFNSDLQKPDLWKEFYPLQRLKNPSLPKQTPPVPHVDGESLFWEMMTQSRTPDPWMYPALLSLKANGKYILAALSNTMIFPPSHPLSASSPVHSIFDVIISSAHVGLRKPEPEIYTLALETVNKFAREDERWRERVELPIEASEVLFLDDIGENCKAGREAGFGTVKVSLGRTFEAVDVLEEVTGLKLAGSHPRIPVKPVIRKKSDGAKL